MGTDNWAVVHGREAAERAPFPDVGTHFCEVGKWQQIETELSIENHWDHGTLWAKTLLYVEIALERDRESWLYPFWSALALELLARTALSSVSPTLLADVTSDDDTSLLYALEKVPEHPGLKVGRSQCGLSPLREAVRRVHERAREVLQRVQQTAKPRATYGRDALSRT